MKVTAIMPDDLINDIKRLTKGKNITQSLILALEDWRNQEVLRSLTKQIKEEPLEFHEGFSAESIRSLNRKK